MLYFIIAVGIKKVNSDNQLACKNVTFQCTCTSILWNLDDLCSSAIIPIHYLSLFYLCIEILVYCLSPRLAYKPHESSYLISLIEHFISTTQHTTKLV